MRVHSPHQPGGSTTYEYWNVHGILHGSMYNVYPSRLDWRLDSFPLSAARPSHCFACRWSAMRAMEERYCRFNSKYGMKIRRKGSCLHGGMWHRAKGWVSLGYPVRAPGTKSSAHEALQSLVSQVPAVVKYSRPTYCLSVPASDLFKPSNDGGASLH